MKPIKSTDELWADIYDAPPVCSDTACSVKELHGHRPPGNPEPWLLAARPRAARKDFGNCERCGEPKTHRCQYRFCEPCLRIVGVPGYPS